MASGDPGRGAPPHEPVGTAGLHPPFNMVSNYRDPGKVNINTIAGAFVFVDPTDPSKGIKLASNVWNATIGGDPSQSGNTATGPTFRDVAASRQGYIPPSSSFSTPPNDPAILYQFDSSHPSIFSNPFRSAAAADMVPLVDIGSFTDERKYVPRWDG